MELELTVLQQPDEELGYLAGFVVTDQMIVALGGVSNRAPTVVASSNARDFERRETPRNLGLRDVIAVADSIWACGEYGQLAVSRDHGESWDELATGTEVCLFGLALGHDGALWVVGDQGYCARVLGDRIKRVDLNTTARFSAVYAVRDEIVVLGFDGLIRRVRDGNVDVVPCGATKALTGLAITTKNTWIVVGDGGFCARSPDGRWYSRAHVGVNVDLEAINTLADGTIVVVGDRGQIVVSRDDGRTWASVPNELGLVHLWSVERFGGGLLIGGDEGLIAKLALPGDATWADRGDVFAGAKPLDAAFAPGPVGFIENGLAQYLEAVAEREDEDEDVEEEEEEAEDADDTDAEAFRLLGQAGTAKDFREIYGVPLPPEAAKFFSLVERVNPWSSFDELRLDNDLRPDVGDANLFELMVRRNQHAYLGTDLVEAFAGVFGIGSQGNGDTYHFEIYEWDGPRQVLHFDHETHSFSGVFSDSLDSLVYLAAIVKVGDDKQISKAAYAEGIEKLRGKVAPTWHFSIEDKDEDFVALDPKRRDSEFFFYRSRWICALLKNDGVTGIDDLPELFNADFNQSIPQDQLQARFEACEKFIPTALYAMWRAYLFDEPELERYLDIGRRNAARLVRDAAKLIDELRGGRNELGTIRDWRAHLAAFRALDLDPRRAEARKAEAEERERQATERKQEVESELAGAEASRWSDLAWRWLGDGVAHRALLERLDKTQSTYVAALDELRDLRDDERAVALPQLAAELSSELEAVLVGSIVRDDRLEGVLTKSATEEDEGEDEDEDEDEDDDDDDDDRSPGWDAIDAVLRPIYGDTKPMHYGTVVPYMLGGNDPIHGISAYPRVDPVPHWHFVTYGFTDLFAKETDDPEESGFGFELTMRLVRERGDDKPPTWALNFLQNLGRYVFGTGNRFAAGHKMGLNGPIALDHDTKITAICFADDPELGDISSEYGSARFVQIVGITDDEYKLIQEWSTTGLVDILQKRLPYLVTDLSRDSVLADPMTAAEVEQRVAQEGSSEDLTFAGELKFEVDDGRVRLELGALYAASLPRAMRGRIRHGRPYELRGRGASLHLRPGAAARYVFEKDIMGVMSVQLESGGGDGELVLEITQELAREIEAKLRTTLAGTYHFEAWPALQIVVTPSFIRGQDGKALEVRGIADPTEATRMLEAENARLAAERSDDDDDDDDDDDWDDDDDDDDGDVPAPERARAALAMTERALRLSPDDDEIQFAHVNLLVDADRAGLEGKIEELFAWLPRFAPAVRLTTAVRLGDLAHPRFGEAVDVALSGSVPTKVMSSSTTPVGGAAMVSYGDVAGELFAELAAQVLEHCPDRMAKLAPHLPPDVNLLADLAHKALEDHADAAAVLYDRLLSLPFPTEGDERTNYLRAMNNACIQAHAARAFDTAVKIADRAQPVAHENPYIYHSSACAYAAVGDYKKAFEQVKLAVQHDYDHVQKVEVDSDLGPLLEWPEFKALFREWHARQEGN